MTKKIIFSIFLLFAAMPSFIYADVSADNTDGIYEEALIKINSGERAEGEKLLRGYIDSSNIPSEKKHRAIYDVLAILSEEGRNAEALEILSSGILPENTFFSQFEKGWSLLSLGKPEQAIKAFSKARALTANQAYLSQSDFAISLAEARRKNTETALEVMARVYTRYPYLLSASSHEIGKLLLGRKEYERAVFFLENSLQYDNTNFQAEIDFARANEKTKSYTSAWQAWRTLKEMDPDEKRYDERLKKLAAKVKGEKDNLMFWQRMDWPVHTSPRKIYGGNKISMALYASPSGTQSEILEVSFMASLDFDIIDDKLGHLVSGKKMTPWKIIFNPEEKMIEIHDSLGSSARSTYGNIDIVSRGEGGVILLKDPLFAEEIPGVNRSDKEAGGGLRFDIAEKGLKIKTIIDEESLACPVTSYLINRTFELSFAKAAAIAARTKIRSFHEHPAHGDYADMCDSRHCLEFQGMQGENMVSSSAVEETAGQILMVPDGNSGKMKTANVSWVRACGGTSKMCLPEEEYSAYSKKRISPFGLYSSFVNSPSEESLCLPESKLDYMDLNWTVILSPFWIESRANRTKKIGKILSIVPMKRDSFGRVLSVRAYGVKGYADFEGEKAVSEFLSAGTLRSSLFSVRPVYKGKYPEFFIVRGSGTLSPGQHGDAVLCLRGAEGMSTKKNAGYKEILENYFPNAAVMPEMPAALSSGGEDRKEKSQNAGSENAAGIKTEYVKHE